MELRLVSAAVVLLGSMASSVWAGEKAQPVSSSALGAMGLARMQPIQDSEGMKVRGKFTFAFVGGFASAGGMTNPFFDAGPTSASGSRFAFAPMGGGSFGFAFSSANAWAN
jgi:hypothetical protein